MDGNAGTLQTATLYWNQTGTTTALSSSITNGWANFTASTTNTAGQVITAYAVGSNTNGQTTQTTQITFMIYSNDMALYVIGNKICSDGTVVALRGVDRDGYEDSAGGYWMDESAYIQANWNSYGYANCIEELNAMQSWGINCIRAFISLDLWVNGSEPALFENFTSLAAARGIYVVITGYEVVNYFQGGGQDPLPYPPYATSPHASSIVPSQGAFINIEGNMSIQLRGYSNILYDIWNEPQATTTNNWFPVLQSCINRMSLYTSQPIVVEGQVASYVNLLYPSSSSTTDNLDWAVAGVSTTTGNLPFENITYSSGNLIFETHLYNDPTSGWHIQNATSGIDGEGAYTLSDINLGLTDMGYYGVAAVHPLFIGEIGLDSVLTGTALTEETEFFNNSLYLFSQYGINFGVFWWRDSGYYPVINSNLSPTTTGTILQKYLAVSPNPAPSVIVSSSSATVDVGQTTTFSASVYGGTNPYAYQWYLNGAPVGTDSGSYSYIATAADLTAGSFNVSVTVTDSASNVVSSNTETVMVNPALVAPTISASVATVNQGQTSALSSTTVSTGTSPYTYQWLQKASGSSYIDVGTNSTSYSFVTSGSTVTGVWSFELQVTDAASAVATSNSVSVTVNATLSAPTVSVSPTSWTMDVGRSKTFSASASGGSGSYASYQWLVGGVAQSGATASTFSFAPVSVGSYLITVTVTDSSGATSAQSSAASVMVNSALVAPTVSVSKGAVDKGQTFSLTSASVSTGTSPYTYQWLQKAPGAGSYSSISRATSSSYSFSTSTSTATGTWSFELKVTDAASAVVTSNSTSVKVNAAPTVSVSPTSWTMNVGQSKTFSATPSGGSGTYTSYQWYVNGVAQTGQIASTFSYSPKSTGSYSITVTVTDSLGATSAQSSPARVRVSR
jgi:hypothetical protein